MCAGVTGRFNRVACYADNLIELVRQGAIERRLVVLFVFQIPFATMDLKTHSARPGGGDEPWMRPDGFAFLDRKTRSVGPKCLDFGRRSLDESCGCSLG